MKLFWTAAALVAALLVQTALSQFVPAQAWMFDPFLLVVVYCGLTGGETYGMLVGAAAGWVQDIHFGGPVVGLSGLSKVVVGFSVGLCGARFHLAEPGARALALFAATLLDALLFGRLAQLFELKVHELSFVGLLARGALNAVVGLAAYLALERRLGPRRP